jgi:hypothetical protein
MNIIIIIVVVVVVVVCIHNVSPPSPQFSNKLRLAQVSNSQSLLFTEPQSVIQYVA